MRCVIDEATFLAGDLNFDSSNADSSVTAVNPQKKCLLNSGLASLISKRTLGTELLTRY